MIQNTRISRRLKKRGNFSGDAERLSQRSWFQAGLMWIDTINPCSSLSDTPSSFPGLIVETGSNRRRGNLTAHLYEHISVTKPTNPSDVQVTVSSTELGGNVPMSHCECLKCFFILCFHLDVILDMSKISLSAWISVHPDQLHQGKG